MVFSIITKKILSTNKDHLILLKAQEKAFMCTLGWEMLTTSQRLPKHEKNFSLSLRYC